MNIRETFLRLTMITISLLLTDCKAGERDVINSEVVLKQDFTDKDYWPDDGLNGIEFCGGDWCQEVRYGEPASRSSAWDAAFLMFYFFDANDEFKEHRKTHAMALLQRHGQGCAAGGREMAACALKNLQNKHGLIYHRVQYDIGYRCTSLFIVEPPYFTARGNCEDQMP